MNSFKKINKTKLLVVSVEEKQDIKQIAKIKNKKDKILFD